MNNLSYVGVDVSKASLDVAGDHFAGRHPNRPAAIAAWVKKLPPGSHLVVEATGGYERSLVEAAHRAALPVSVLNPARARHFARARGILAKTDPIDAVLLRDFGRALAPKPTPPPDPAVRELAELVATRDHLVKLRTALTNGLEQARLPLVRRCLTRQRRALERDIAKLEKAMAAVIAAAAKLAARYQALRAVPGMGLLTAATLLALLPELGSANRKQIAALAGLAPFNRDSGQSSGPRFITGGRPRLRRALYLATLSVIRSSSPLAAFYHRLRLSGKPAKLALIATARKLLCFLNSSLKPIPC